MGILSKGSWNDKDEKIYSFRVCLEDDKLEREYNQKLLNPNLIDSLWSELEIYKRNNPVSCQMLSEQINKYFKRKENDMVWDRVGTGRDWLPFGPTRSERQEKIAEWEEKWNKGEIWENKTDYVYNWQKENFSDNRDIFITMLMQTKGKLPGRVLYALLRHLEDQ